MLPSSSGPGLRGLAAEAAFFAAAGGAAGGAAWDLSWTWPEEKGSLVMRVGVSAAALAFGGGADDRSPEERPSRPSAGAAPNFHVFGHLVAGDALAADMLEMGPSAAAQPGAFVEGVGEFAGGGFHVFGEVFSCLSMRSPIMSWSWVGSSAMAGSFCVTCSSICHWV